MAVDSVDPDKTPFPAGVSAGTVEREKHQIPPQCASEAAHVDATQPALFVSGGGSSSSVQAPSVAPALFSLGKLLREAKITPPRVRIVDVGAMILDEAEAVWTPLLRAGHVDSVTAFEPCEDECDRLQAEADRNKNKHAVEFKVLPWALGDGTLGEFRRCAASMTSSMLEPNIPLLRRFVQLEEVTTVVERTPMETKRLDDLRADLPGRFVDFLKLDVQGYELAVLKGSPEILQKVLVVQTEVEFVQMYKDQPLFAEVDQFMRANGFVFHQFTGIHGRPMKPIHLVKNPLQPISQHMWADAVYVRDMWDLEGHSQEEKLKTAIILHELYHSYDVVHHVLAKCGEDVAKAYLNRTLGAQ